MSSTVEVRQSSESATRFDCEICGLEISLTFLSAAKGRMDFAIDISGSPKGKVNVLSQHSIVRVDHGLDGDAKKLFCDTMLAVGIILRDGTYIPAPKEERKLVEENSYIGQDSTLGSIDADTISEFLASEDLLDRVNEVLHESRETPFVGDDANLILTFLVMLSCKTGMPLNLEMIGQSASGKTYMTLTARNGFPKSMVMVLAGASREALKYDYDEIDDEGNFIVNVDGKCIVVLEKDESEAFIRKMKPLMSGDDSELVWKTPMKNEMTGEIETRDFVIRGQPSFITLTTRNPREQEQITRQLLMTPDSTSDKVGQVVSNQLLSKARPEQFVSHPDVKLLQASMLSLERYKVRNIFAPVMAEFFPAKSAQHQRDIGKVLSIIDAITLLHQKQRAVEEIDGREYLLSSIEDNVLGLILADLVLRASLSGVPDGSWVVFTELTRMADAKRPLTVDNILQWLHINAFNTTKNALTEKHLPTLEDAGLIEIGRRGGGRGGGRKTWKIVKTRTGLMETYALSPLFVEHARKQLPDILDDFSDVLARANPPKSFRKLSKGDKTILKKLGCSSARESGVWRSVLLPTYLRPTNKGRMLWGVIGSNTKRDELFSGKAWFDSTLKSEATEELTKKREAREAVKKMTVSPHSDEGWEQLAELYLDEMDDSQ
jgi:hypothetical protein